ncbi:putative SNF2 family helicase/ATPase [Macrophomina phaseolina]|uniref:SNF2 family helicase/ATPase n=1 Tax=Macrophomina phaseolina TaxID=35725 RepID=A0ABQ8FWB5_9PEZI|nr:putative SNF2 family helicase/ATPase [Macrophomina phaseolina]
MKHAGDPIVDTPPKRRRIEGGYNSQDDDGDELLAGFDETAATLPLKQPYNPAAPTLSSPYFAPSAPGITQPTQILETPLRNRVDPNAVVQVPASSPLGETQRTTISPSPQKNRPTTQFARPGINSRQPHLATNAGSFSDSPAEETSEDELAKPRSKSDIKPSTFVSKSKPRYRIPAPKNAPPSGYQLALSQFMHREEDVQSKTRSADDMANAYSSQKRRRPPPQTVPSRAQPVSDAAMANFTLDDIDDLLQKRKVERMALVYSDKPVKLLYQALLDKKGNYEDALAYVCELEEKQEATKSQPAQKTSLASTIDLTADDTSPVKALKPSTNKSVQSNKSIASKWSSMQATKTGESEKRTSIVEIPDDDSSAADSSAKPRRRLVQGRRPAARSPTPERTLTPQKSSATRQKKAVAIDSDSDAENSDEEEIDEQAALEAEASLLSYINKCSAQDLADLAESAPDECEGILAKRPFRSLDQIRKVELNPPKLTKTGKVPRTHTSTGTRVLNVAEKMWAAYQSVNVLVSECQTIGEPIKAAMKQLGVKSLGSDGSGELNIISLGEIKKDSGIGTPSSCTQVDEEDDDIVANSRFKPIQKPSLMAKDLVLKDYQVVGLNWLNILWTNQVSGILADDMGLGKTCQIIAFLSHLKETGQEGLHLIVVPNSTLENWLREFDKFTEKKLRVEPYYGGQSERAGLRDAIMNSKDEIDVVITTYSTMGSSDKNDLKFLRRLDPTACIFDEGHQLRNRTSQKYRCAIQIPAKIRLILTGTPLQNNLQEMVSLLSFLMPDVFDEHADNLNFIFRKKATTTEKNSHNSLLSAQRTARARSMMTPFILRRKKEQVLGTVLPKKISRVEYCDMDPKQAKVYADIKAMQQEVFLKRKQGLASSGTNNYLMKLRLTSCHPLLARHWFDDAKIRRMAEDHFAAYGSPKMERTLDYLRKCNDYAIMQDVAADPSVWGQYQLQEDLTHASGKIQKTIELVKDFMKNGDRTLFFSQFKMVLDVMEDALSAEGIPFLRFDGGTATSGRQDLIDQFYQDEEIPIFLVSTGSGGSGINITAANKVIINDLSWNPQEDIQAENRAHRVGQLRDVEVIRLVTRGTVEEQILALGDSKLALDERVAGAGAFGDDAKTAKVMQEIVEKMMFEDMEANGELKAPAEDVTDTVTGSGDLADQFKSGLKKAGVEVAE